MKNFTPTNRINEKKIGQKKNRKKYGAPRVVLGGRKAVYGEKKTMIPVTKIKKKKRVDENAGTD